MISIFKHIAIGIGITGFLVLYFVYNPAQHAFFPKCPFRAATGWLCPSCGSQRALHALLHLRLADAFAANPLVPIALPYLLGVWWTQTKAAQTRYARVRNFFYGRKALLTVVFIVIAFWIGRNI